MNKYLNILFLLFPGILLMSCNSREELKNEIKFEAVGESMAFDLKNESYPFPDTKAGYDSAGKYLKSPLMNTTEHQAKGRTLFETYCKHCHGINGQSNAPMIEKEKYPPPPKFRDRLPEISEGQIFHSIYYGKNLMPANKNDLTQEEIWLLVQYIQTLATTQEDDTH